MSLRQLFAGVPVVPVLTIAEATAAVPLGRALATGGLTVLEITLRTPAATEAIRRIAGELPHVLPGAGTVRNGADVRAATAAGARFLVSPGLSRALVEAAGEAGLPLLPGIATASEAMAASELGLDELKFFPAVPAGGIAALKALAGPFPELAFCPTGGIGAASWRDFLALPNVFAVGGSWVAPPAAVTAGDWTAITELARAVTGPDNRAVAEAAPA